MPARRMVSIIGFTLGAAFFLTGWARLTPDDGPRYTNETHLVRPTDYREWPFLGSGLGLTYNTSSEPDSSPGFTNVFVNPSSYHGFMESGVWPDGTISVLEIRSPRKDAPPNQGACSRPNCCPWKPR